METDAIETDAKVAAARAWAERALEAADLAWGTDGPVIAMLEGRIAEGELYCQEHPDNLDAAALLAQLREQLATARKRNMNQRHYARWKQARKALEEALERYLAAVRDARARQASPQQARLV